MTSRAWCSMSGGLQPLIRGFVLVPFLLFFLAPLGASAQDEDETVTFEIRGFRVEGNSLLMERTVYDALVGFAGPEKTAEDVEAARDRLEALYHESGYPAVLVNIPAQTVEDGMVDLEIIETKIRRLRVTGNRYFTMETIKKRLPSLQPGEVLFVPAVQQELGKINRNPDLKVSPVLIPGQDLGSIDVELKVKDRLPLHGSLEVNNRNTHDTSSLRLNGMIRYDNLWQKEHSVSFQYQTSPLEPEEVQVLAASYVLPAPWNIDHLVAFYGVWSDSQTAFGEGFEVLGAGTLFGARYVIPLPPKAGYSHSVTLGVDYKDFEESLGFQGEEGGTQSPISYLPLSVTYSSSLPDKTGRIDFSASVNLSIRGLMNDSEEFALKRFRAKPNYLYATFGVERMQKLPLGWGIHLKIDGQIADQPLLSNEQYTAGGMESVRGYKENEALGDNALHGTVELIAPEVMKALGWEVPFGLQPFLFYDRAELHLKDALPEQDSRFTLQGAGAGVRGTILQGFEYSLEWASALEETERVEKGDEEIYLRLKYAF